MSSVPCCAEPAPALLYSPFSCTAYIRFISRVHVVHTASVCLTSSPRSNINLLLFLICEVYFNREGTTIGRKYRHLSSVMSFVKDRRIYRGSEGVNKIFYIPILYELWLPFSDLPLLLPALGGQNSQFKSPITYERSIRPTIISTQEHFHHSFPETVAQTAQRKIIAIWPPKS